MIAANELRIGNKVQYKGDTHTITEIGRRLIRSYHIEESDDWIHFPNEIEPIPLTPEILEKCGFEYWTLDHDCVDPKDAYWVCKNHKFKYSIANLSWKVNRLDVRVKYLHQLQNLYFALTGEELNYQP